MNVRAAATRLATSAGQIRPALTTLLALAVALGAMAAIQAVLGSGGHEKVARSPEFVVWSALAAVSVTIYAQVFVRLVGSAPGWARRARTGLVAPILAYALVAAIVFFLLTGRGPQGTLETVPLVMRPLYAIALTAGAPAVLGLWLVHGQVRVLGVRMKQAGEAKDVLRELLDTRADLGRCLAGLSLIASTGLINTAALRKAYLAHYLSPEQFPSELVLLYGAGITVIVALIYVPAFLAWRDRARAFIDQVYQLPPDARPAQDWSEGRARLRELLGADATVAKTLAAAFGILAPLATSLVGVFVPELQG